MPARNRKAPFTKKRDDDEETVQLDHTVIETIETRPPTDDGPSMMSYGRSAWVWAYYDEGSPESGHEGRVCLHWREHGQNSKARDSLNDAPVATIEKDYLEIGKCYGERTGYNITFHIGARPMRFRLDLTGVPVFERPSWTQIQRYTIAIARDRMLK